MGLEQIPKELANNGLKSELRIAKEKQVTKEERARL
jgi:hypothetical protein